MWQAPWLDRRVSRCHLGFAIRATIISMALAAFCCAASGLFTYCEPRSRCEDIWHIRDKLPAFGCGACSPLVCAVASGGCCIDATMQFNLTPEALDFSSFDPNETMAESKTCVGVARHCLRSLNHLRSWVSAPSPERSSCLFVSSTSMRRWPTP